MKKKSLKLFFFSKFKDIFTFCNVSVATAILEDKAAVQSSRGDGGGGEAGSSSSSPAAQSLTLEEGAGRWQSDSLMAESWSTMGDVDTEDAKSLNDSDEVPKSDMVRLEPEDVVMLEEAVRRAEEGEVEAEEMQMSVVSLLGGEKELMELREEEMEELQAPDTEGILVTVEETYHGREPAEFKHVVPPMALPLLPILKLDPPSTTSTPVSSTTAYETEELYAAQGLHPPSILAPMTVLPTVEKPSVEELSGPQLATEKLEPKTSTPVISTELLLCGAAASVAIIGVVAYGAVAYCRK